MTGTWLMPCSFSRPITSGTVELALTVTSERSPRLLRMSATVPRLVSGSMKPFSRIHASLNTLER